MLIWGARMKKNRVKLFFLLANYSVSLHQGEAFLCLPYPSTGITLWPPGAPCFSLRWPSWSEPSVAADNTWPPRRVSCQWPITAPRSASSILIGRPVWPPLVSSRSLQWGWTAGTDTVPSAEKKQLAALCNLVHCCKNDDNKDVVLEICTLFLCISTGFGCHFLSLFIKGVCCWHFTRCCSWKRTWSLSKLFIWTACFGPLSAAWPLVTLTILPKWPQRGQNTKACVGWEEEPKRAAKPQTKTRPQRHVELCNRGENCSASRHSWSGNIEKIKLYHNNNIRELIWAVPIVRAL